MLEELNCVGNCGTQSTQLSSFSDQPCSLYVQFQMGMCTKCRSYVPLNQPRCIVCENLIGPKMRPVSSVRMQVLLGSCSNEVGQCRNNEHGVYLLLQHAMLFTHLTATFLQYAANLSIYAVKTIQIYQQNKGLVGRMKYLLIL